MGFLWNLPKPEIKLVSSALVGGSLTTGPSEKSFMFYSKIICPSPIAMPHKAVIISLALAEFLLVLYDPRVKDTVSKPDLFTLRITFYVPISIFCQYPPNWAWQGRERMK